MTGFHKRKLQRRKEAQECAAAPAPLCVVPPAWVPSQDSTGRAACRKLEEKARKLRLEERAKARARRAPARAAHGLLATEHTPTEVLEFGNKKGECNFSRVQCLGASACEWVPPRAPCSASAAWSKSGSRSGRNRFASTPQCLAAVLSHKCTPSSGALLPGGAEAGGAAHAAAAGPLRDAAAVGRRGAARHGGRAAARARVCGQRPADHGHRCAHLHVQARPQGAQPWGSSRACRMPARPCSCRGRLGTCGDRVPATHGRMLLLQPLGAVWRHACRRGRTQACIVQLGAGRRDRTCCRRLIRPPRAAAMRSPAAAAARARARTQAAPQAGARAVSPQACGNARAAAPAPPRRAGLLAAAKLG